MPERNVNKIIILFSVLTILITLSGCVGTEKAIGPTGGNNSSQEPTEGGVEELPITPEGEYVRAYGSLNILVYLGYVDDKYSSDDVDKLDTYLSVIRQYFIEKSELYLGEPVYLEFTISDQHKLQKPYQYYAMGCADSTLWDSNGCKDMLGELSSNNIVPSEYDAIVVLLRDSASNPEPEVREKYGCGGFMYACAKTSNLAFMPVYSDMGIEEKSIQGGLAHELFHLFGATDETYELYTHSEEYARETGRKYVPEEAVFYISPEVAAEFGWEDEDGDGVKDVIELQ